MYWPFDRVGFGPGHGYGAVGHTLDNGWRNTLVNLRQLRSWLFGWPAGLDLVPVIAAVVVALVMVVVWVQRRGRRGADAGPLPAAPTGLGLGSTGFDLLLFGVAASLVVAHLAYWTPGAVHGPRYYYEGMAALALLAARAAGHAAAALRRAGVRADWSRPVVAGAFVALSAVGVVTTTADRVEAARHYYGVRTEGLRAVEALHLHRALVFVPTGHWTDFEPYSAANSPFLDTDVVYAVDMGDRNQELVDAMPDRTAYVWSEGVLTPGSAGG